MAKSIIMIAFFLTMPISSTMPMIADHVEVVTRQHQREQRADAGRGQGGENRHRVDEAFVQHAQHDVDDDDRGEDEKGFVRQRRTESVGGAQELGHDAGRHPDLRFRPGDGVHRFAERRAGRQVESDRGGRELRHP